MEPLSLTQDEARERAALIAVERYEIDVDFTDLPTGDRVGCVSTVEFSCRRPGASTFVDCAAQVVEATLNGKPLGPPAEGRILLPDLSPHNRLVVRTTQADTTNGAGVHKAVDPADGEVYVWTSFEPDEARFVWACFDQPDLKAPHAFTVTAPAAWTVTSNSGAPQIEDAGEGASAGAARRWTFADTPPLSTYNAVVNAGPFHQVRRTAGGHDLGLYARRSLAALLDRDAEEIFTLTEQGLGFYGRVFGMPFPQRTYDQVFMPEFGGAMENYGCVTWSDGFLQRSAPTAAERELFAKVLLHEMAHMWFGNIVTMRWWDDLWLNEAFAEFACHWAAVEATAYRDAWAGHLATGKQRAYLTDQGPISHPIRTQVRSTAEAASIFDAITYDKGASVLKQLMTYVGEENFSAGMTAYFARYAWSNATLQDLIDALGKASGRDLDAWRAGWLETAGTDRLALERDGDGLVLVADGPGPGIGPRPQVLAVGAYATDGTGTGLRRLALATVDVEQARTPVELPVDAQLYLVNDEDLTFAVATVEPARSAALIAAAPGLPTAISRGVAVATVWDLLVKGGATAADTVRCVTSVLAVETGDSVIEPYLDLAVASSERWAPEKQRAELAALVAATARQLADDPNRRQVALRAFAKTAASLEDVEWLRRQAGDEVDLLWRALTRKAELGGEVADEVAGLLERDPNPEAWIRALTVRAAAPSAEAKEGVWQKVTDERAVPVGAVSAVMSAFWRPGQDELLAPYAGRYLDLLPALERGGMIPAMVFTNQLFPLYGIGRDYPDAALAAAEPTAPVVRKTLTERADLVRRMLRSR
ncbi:aminopeptidase N [Actinocrinis sp.]|uniref:aminopeptidase N n=1 Tax=Actinocrinis sp. TaxID=1920516 RepID=UPI002D28E449|nr:aminopeptidase N [Actinocrinis sp.]HZP51842.1 aminopeptidase N [Actinocrinis sp.]